VSTRDLPHPVFARMFARMSERMEDAGAREYRREMLEGLAGRVIEVGAGNGLNFRHYPETVTEVVALEPEPYLRERARKAAAEAPVPIDVTDGVADDLPAGEAAFDAGVASLVLCSVPDQASALAELFRVIRPGGELRFFEHVAARSPGLARLQRTVDRLFWPRVGGGCHTHRDTAAAIERAGFTIEEIRRFPFRVCILTAPVTPHIVGRARRP
jgi:ubiquinone/menaquinone biosynthesis C-methylase UbiE